MKAKGLTRVLVSVALMASALGAQASTIVTLPSSPSGPLLYDDYFGLFDGTVTGTGVSFLSEFFFQLPNLSDLGGAVANVVVNTPLFPGTEFDIESLSLSLFSTGVSGVGGSLVGGGLGVTSLSLLNLAAGYYRIEISGLTDGTLGGKFDGAVGISSVPLPAAVWLLLSGLVGVGALSRRRRRLAAA